MENKCSFNFRMPLFYSNDPYFVEYKKLIKDYFLLYDYFVMDSTIEGALITSNNLSDFREYVKFEGEDEGRKIHRISRKTQRFQEIENELEESTEQEVLTAYRILYNGKSDLLLQHKQMINNNPNIHVGRVKQLYDVLEESFASKTAGWVSRWIEYFICKLLNISPYENDTYIKARRIMNSDKADEVRQKFKTKFPELDNWISEMIIRSKGD